MYVAKKTGCGMGALTMDGTGLFGTGLFVEPFNLSTWNWGEYAAVGFGLFVLYSITSTAERGVEGARKAIRRRRK